jgi:2-oxoisovalerate dehydrogenase E1 component
MDLDRAQAIDTAFKYRTQQGDFPAAKSVVNSEAIHIDVAMQIFRSQCISRHLDLKARKLKSENKSFYTIGSSGHEGSASIAKAFRLIDPAFLHYRSGAFMAMRSMQAKQNEFIYHQCLSLVASSDDPISGGRHKVFGSKALNVAPQTSTIASHGPKAFGSAFALMLSKSFKGNDFFEYEPHAVVLASFGDASLNHSTMQGAINSTLWLAHQKTPMPIVWICEDNEIGISVPTPRDWVNSSISSRKNITYVQCDGLNFIDVYLKAKQAEHIARIERKPVFLHMRTVRLLGHAGSDVEFHYRTEKEILATESQDPLLHTARILHQEYNVTLIDILNIYHEIENQVLVSSNRALTTHRLQSATEVMQSIIPPKKDIKINLKIDNPPQNKFTVAQSLNSALREVLESIPQCVIFGEDVGKKGGVYWVTQGLQKKYGAKRVFDTLLDEQSILGTALGLAQSGFLPIPEIQFLAYTHNAIDQLRGEAATLPFFSNGQYTNPMVIRVPSFAYQKGFGGHFHNENAFAFLREIPGIIIATFSNPHDGATMLKNCVKLALEQQRVVVLMEPIALYHQKDLYTAGDGELLQNYPQLVQDPSKNNAKYTIISYANGMHLSKIAAKTLEDNYNIQVNLFDLKWLKPLPKNELLKFIDGNDAVFIIDECRKTGSISEEIITLFVEELSIPPKIKRITAKDSFIPLGDAWKYILPSAEEIVNTVNNTVKSMQPLDTN